MSEIKRLKYKIIKKGRKWLTGVNERGYRAQIEINDKTENWEVGQTYEFDGRLEFQRSRFGTKVYVYPASEQEIHDFEKKNREYNKKKLLSELDRWLGYVRDSALKGRIYEKGINKVKELADRLKKETLTDAEKEKIASVEAEVTKIPEEASAGRILNSIDRFFSYAVSEKRCREILSAIEADLNSFRESIQKMSVDDIKESCSRWYEKLKGVFYCRRKAGELLKSVEASESLKTRVSEDQRKKLIKLKENYDRITAAFESLKSCRDEKIRLILIKEEERSGASSIEIEGLEDRDKDVEEWKLQLYRHGRLKKGQRYFAVKLPYVASGLAKELGGLFFMKAKDYFSFEEDKDREEPFWIFPERKRHQVEKLIELTKNWKKDVYQKLSSLEGEPVQDIDKELPHSWNHIKREYVAVVSEDMDFTLISSPVNFTSSGKNADLEYSLPDKDGTIIAARSGSYKHLGFNFYRRENGKWYCIADAPDCPTFGRAIEFLWENFVADEVKEKLADSSRSQDDCYPHTGSMQIG